MCKCWHKLSSQHPIGGFIFPDPSAGGVVIRAIGTFDNSLITRLRIIAKVIASEQHTPMKIYFIKFDINLNLMLANNIHLSYRNLTYYMISKTYFVSNRLAWQLPWYPLHTSQPPAARLCEINLTWNRFIPHIVTILLDWVVPLIRPTTELHHLARASGSRLYMT